MTPKKVKDFRPKSGGGIDKEKILETTVRDMKTGQEISRSAATYTSGRTKSAKPSKNEAISALRSGANQYRQGLATAVRNDNPAVGYKMGQAANTAKASAAGAATARNMADQLKSKQYELSQNKSGTQKTTRSQKPAKGYGK